MFPPLSDWYETTLQNIGASVRIRFESSTKDVPENSGIQGFF